MSSLPAIMATAGALPLLPDEIVIWEILVHLPPKTLLRCRAVCRAWRQATSTRDFLVAHHAHQPNLPIFCGGDCVLGVMYDDMLAFDHRAAADARLHTVARLEGNFHLEACCEGLLLLSKLDRCGEPESPACLLICNPATREHASIRPPWDFGTLGMYRHRPTGEHRLLLQRKRTGWHMAAEDQGCYVFALGSSQPASYIGWRERASDCFSVPVMLRDGLHWCPTYYPCERKHVMVFDTITESFRHMRPPILPSNSYCRSVFEMGGMLAVQSSHGSTEIIDIWVLHNYESEVWDHKYRILLPIEEIMRKFPVYGLPILDVVSRDSDVLLLLSYGWYLFHIDRDGKLIGRFNHGSNHVDRSKCRLKQSLVQHNFFPTLEDYAVNALPLYGSS